MTGLSLPSSFIDENWPLSGVVSGFDDVMSCVPAAPSRPCGPSGPAGPGGPPGSPGSPLAPASPLSPFGPAVPEPPPPVDGSYTPTTSTITSTVPALLYRFSRPDASRPVVTWFGVAAWPATQLRLLASGRALSAGHTVKKLPAVAFTVVTLSTAPVAVGDSARQLPKLPRAV